MKIYIETLRNDFHRPPPKWAESGKGKDSMDKDGYQELANAIVAQAGMDYIQAMDILRQCPDARDAGKEARRIERFMRSAWFGMLTKADPEYLIRKLRETKWDERGQSLFVSSEREIRKKENDKQW